MQGYCYYFVLLSQINIWINFCRLITSSWVGITIFRIHTQQGKGYVYEGINSGMGDLCITFWEFFLNKREKKIKKYLLV